MDETDNKKPDPNHPSETARGVGAEESASNPTTDKSDTEPNGKHTEAESSTTAEALPKADDDQASNKNVTGTADSNTEKESQNSTEQTSDKAGEGAPAATGATANTDSAAVSNEPVATPTDSTNTGDETESANKDTAATVGDTPASQDMTDAGAEPAAVITTDNLTEASTTPKETTGTTDEATATPDNSIDVNNDAAVTPEDSAKVRDEAVVAPGDSTNTSTETEPVNKDSPETNVQTAAPQDSSNTNSDAVGAPEDSLKVHDGAVAAAAPGDSTDTSTETEPANKDSPESNVQTAAPQDSANANNDAVVTPIDATSTHDEEVAAVAPSVSADTGTGPEPAIKDSQDIHDETATALKESTGARVEAVTASSDSTDTGDTVAVTGDSTQTRDEPATDKDSADAATAAQESKDMATETVIKSPDSEAAINGQDDLRLTTSPANVPDDAEESTLKVDAVGTGLQNEVPSENNNEPLLSTGTDFRPKEGDNLALARDAIPALNNEEHHVLSRPLDAIVRNDVQPISGKHEEVPLKSSNDQIPDRSVGEIANTSIAVADDVTNRTSLREIHTAPSDTHDTRIVIDRELSDNEETNTLLKHAAPKAVVEDSNGIFDKIVSLSQKFAVVIAFVGIMLILPIVQVIIGSSYKSSCPMNYLIPRYLLVAGILGILLLVLVVSKFYLKHKLGKASDVGSFFQYLLFIIYLGWFFVGCVWVFGGYPRVQTTDPSDTSYYCDSTVFHCAFITVIITAVFVFVFMCCSCCIRAAKEEPAESLQSAV